MMRAWTVLGLTLMVSPALAQGSFETTVRAARAIAPGQVELGSQTLHDTGAQTAIDTLEWDVSLVASTGGRGERIFTLRGFDQRQVAVLLDGAPFELPYDGQLDLAMVPAALIERIELIKGPGTVAVGPNGLGGAVNIVTRRGGDGPFARLWTETSPPGTFELRGAHSFELDPVAWTVSGGHFEQAFWPLSSSFTSTPYEAGPTRSNSDKRLDHVAVSATARLTPDQELAATAWWFEGERGMPPATNDDLARYWRFTVWRAINAQLAHRVQLMGGASVDTMIWVREFDNRLDSYDNALYRTQVTPRAFSSWYHDPVVGVRSRGRRRVDVPWGSMELRLWAGGQWEGHSSTSVPGSPQHTERLTGTLIPEAETTFGRRVTVQLALQGDLEVPLQMPGERPGTSLGPRATVQWRPTGGLALSLAGARTSRFPSLKERFSSGLGTRLANPALGPEAAWSATTEVRWVPVQSLELLVLGSHSAVEGLITTVSLAGGLSQLQNVAHAQLSSVEGKLAWSPLPSLRLEAGVQGLRAVQLSGSGEAVPLDYRAPLQVVGSVRFAPLPQFVLWAGVRASGPRPFLNPDSHLEDSLPAFADLSVRVEGRPAPAVAAWVRASNLLDTAVDSTYGYPRPGRQLFAGLSLDLDRPTPGVPP